jgi:hypothetical protein
MKVMAVELKGNVIKGNGCRASQIKRNNKLVWNIPI